jgi:hypothetical protein
VSPAINRITSLGSIARQALTQAQAASVWGISSHGIFLHLSSGRVIFLSFDPFKGPLTLNSTLRPALFEGLRPGLTVRIGSDRLTFDTLGLEVDLDQAEIWSAPTRITPAPADLAGRFDRLQALNQKVLAVRPNSTPFDLLSDSLGPAGMDFLQISAHLEKYLGLGEGLTPSGDDLAIGYLLALNRWGGLLYPELDVREINRSLWQAAFRKTNTLSANLIECASLGQADERLLLALDGILTGEPGADACAAALLSWGHTSGAAALAGMALAIAPKITTK